MPCESLPRCVRWPLTLLVFFYQVTLYKYHATDEVLKSCQLYRVCGFYSENYLFQKYLFTYKYAEPINKESQNSRYIFSLLLIRLRIHFVCSLPPKRLVTDSNLYFPLQYGRHACWYDQLSYLKASSEILSRFTLLLSQPNIKPNLSLSRSKKQFLSKISHWSRVPIFLSRFIAPFLFLPRLISQRDNIQE